MSEAPLISVCIPVFNGEVISLVKSLADQCESLENHVEIIVIDDCSDIDWKLKNESIKNSCNYIELEENIGRSKIRNLFLEHAQGEYLLFIDGDSEIIDSLFIQKYIDFIQENSPEVLVGASVYLFDTPDREHLLRWEYSRKRESKNAIERKKSRGGFKTNNFAIKRSVFSNIQFNNALVGYGHEDTLFGIELDRNKIKIDHIENPVLNKHLDSNQLFLIKTENAIRNLVQLYGKSNEITEIKRIRLIRFYEKIKERKLINLVNLFFLIFRPMLLKLLQSGYFFLWMFDFYKLGLFVRQIKV